MIYNTAQELLLFHSLLSGPVKSFGSMLIQTTFTLKNDETNELMGFRNS